MDRIHLHEIPLLRHIVIGLLLLAVCAVAVPSFGAEVQCDGPCVCTISCTSTNGPIAPPPPIIPPAPVLPPPPPVVPPGDCPAPPAGYVRHNLSWQQAFYGQSFPDVDKGGLSPVGSPSVRGQPMRGAYITIPFVPGSNTPYRVEWNRDQAVPSRRHGGGMPADVVYVTVSPCAGDFRMADRSALPTDPLAPGCRHFAQDGKVYFGTHSANQCKLVPGRQYFLNIVFADPRGGLDPGESTCANGVRCSANFGQ